MQISNIIFQKYPPQKSNQGLVVDNFLSGCMFVRSIEGIFNDIDFEE